MAPAGLGCRSLPLTGRQPLPAAAATLIKSFKPEPAHHSGWHSAALPWLPRLGHLKAHAHVGKEPVVLGSALQRSLLEGQGQVCLRCRQARGQAQHAVSLQAGQGVGLQHSERQPMRASGQSVLGACRRGKVMGNKPASDTTCGPEVRARWGPAGGARDGAATQHDTVHKGLMSEHAGGLQAGQGSV